MVDNSIKRLIEELLNLDKKNVTRKDYRIILSKLLPNRIGTVFSHPSNELFYRVVEYNIEPNHVKEVSYNNKINFHNRGALPNEPVFYCSEDIKTALLETNVEIGKRYVVGEWENTERFNVHPIGYDISNISFCDRIIPSIEVLGEVNPCHPFEMPDENDIFVHDEIARIFLQGRTNENILLINSVAEYVYQSISIANAFLYPPANKRLNGRNYIIRKNLIDDTVIICRNLLHIEITNINNEIDFLILNYAPPPVNNQNLNWCKKFTSIEWNTNKDICFSDAHGHWQAFDAESNLLFEQDIK